MANRVGGLDSDLACWLILEPRWAGSHIENQSSSIRKRRLGFRGRGYPQQPLDLTPPVKHEHLQECFVSIAGGNGQRWM